MVLTSHKFLMFMYHVGIFQQISLGDPTICQTSVEHHSRTRVDIGRCVPSVNKFGR